MYSLVPGEIKGAKLPFQMDPKSNSFIEGAKCQVIAGTHKGKSGIARDLNTSKTGAVTITVVQENGDRFKTLAKNVIVLA